LELASGNARLPIPWQQDRATGPTRSDETPQWRRLPENGRDWNTFSGNEFEEQFIGNPRHPDHPEFEAILKSPMFGDMIIDPGNMWQFIKLDSKPVYVNLERDALHP
jgi:hypothetical protein